MRIYIPIVIIVFTLGSCGTKKVTPEIFLIPTNYRGTVKIIFEQPCGEKESMEDNKRVYVVPENGVLITQFKQEFGIINQEYYYYDAKGGKTLIPKMMLQDFNEATTTKRNENEPSRDQVGIFEWGSTGKAQEVDGIKYEFYNFYVGTYTEVRDSFSTMFDGGEPYSQQFDSIVNTVFRLCRTETVE